MANELKAAREQEIEFEVGKAFTELPDLMNFRDPDWRKKYLDYRTKYPRASIDERIAPILTEMLSEVNQFEDLQAARVKADETEARTIRGEKRRDLTAFRNEQRKRIEAEQRAEKEGFPLTSIQPGNLTFSREKDDKGIMDDIRFLDDRVKALMSPFPDELTIDDLMKAADTQEGPVLTITPKKENIAAPDPTPIQVDRKLAERIRQLQRAALGLQTTNDPPQETPPAQETPVTPEPTPASKPAEEPSRQATPRRKPLRERLRSRLGLK